MKFINKLLPFSENLLTAIWAIFLILLCLAAVLYLFSRLASIRKSIQKDTFREKEELKDIWQAYKASFSNYGSVEKTAEPSDNFFNEHSILFACMNIRVINNVSNTLVGLGILGTFVGLTNGIADSNFETAEAIKKSIDTLLSGMGTAFVTSIWGMGLSLVFTIIFKYQQTRISRKIQSLCFNLDAEYKVKQIDLDKIQEEKQRTLIHDLFNEYLVADTDDGKQLPKNVFRQLLVEAENQTTSLRSFADSLGKSIKRAMDELVESNNNQISSLIEEKLVPVLEDLKKIKEESGSQVIENSIQRLTESMKSMMEDFKNSVSGDTKKELEGLTVRLTTVSESLTRIPDTMTDITLQVSETIEALKESVIKNIERSKNETSEQNKQVREVFTAATGDYKSTVESIQAHMEILMSTQKDNINQVSELTGKINQTLHQNSQVNDQFDVMIQKSKAVSQSIESAANKFDRNSDSFVETSTLLKKSISDFERSIKEYVDRNDKLLDHQKESLNDTANVATIYAERFETIESGLKGIFSQIQDGLREYQDTTSDNLDKYLDKFTTLLTNAHNGLEKNVGGLYEIAEELTDSLQKKRLN